VPDREAFGHALYPDAARHRSLAQLHALLIAVEDPAASGLAGQFDMVARLARWVCAGGAPPRGLADSLGEKPAATRLRLLVSALEQFPELRSSWTAALAAVVASTSSIKLLAETGLHNDRGLVHETADRLARRFLPRPPERGDLAELLARAVRGRGDGEWLGSAPPDLFARLAALVAGASGPLAEAAIDAIGLLATRVSALGLTEDMRARSPPGPLRDSPFFRLPRAPLAELPAAIVECRGRAEEVLHRLEHHGVSVDMVYCLDAIRLALDRIEALLPLVQPADPSTAGSLERMTALRGLLASLAAARLADRSLRRIVHGNLKLLARKIIERAGQTGEHYVTRTRREWWGMIGSAAGGGVLTAFTCAVKFLTKWGHFAPFVDGMLSAANYAASFIVMQLCGFTLATKQPSMTAAMLAGSIHQARDDHRLDDLVTLIARISRSQFAAALGNVLMVIPAALAFDWLYARSAGQHFLDPAAAGGVVASFHPLESGTIFFAALTGVLLWISSLGAGWLENWTTYRRLPEAIEHHRVGGLVGRRTMRGLARFFARHVSGLGGNVTLGLLLGMTPVLGLFFGLPLDVRHVTLSTGSLALAGVALGSDALSQSAFLWAGLGILLIGLLNFGVSFVLALMVAFRAREVGQLERLRLLGAVVRRFFRSPLEFFLPPREPGPPLTASHTLSD
jgi:site-specific recombinase